MVAKLCWMVSSHLQHLVLLSLFSMQSQLLDYLMMPDGMGEVVFLTPDEAAPLVSIP